MDAKPRKRHVASATEWAVLHDRLARQACHLCWSARGHHAHHVVSRAQGGDDWIENLVAVCWQCHDLVHRRDEKALGLMRRHIDEHPETLDYVVARKGWGWLDRVYPK